MRKKVGTLLENWAMSPFIKKCQRIIKILKWNVCVFLLKPSRLFFIADSNFSGHSRVVRHEHDVLIWINSGEIKFWCISRKSPLKNYVSIIELNRRHIKNTRESDCKMEFIHDIAFFNNRSWSWIWKRMTDSLEEVSCVESVSKKSRLTFSCSALWAINYSTHKYLQFFVRVFQGVIFAVLF